jgi:hypothetical protein
MRCVAYSSSDLYKYKLAKTRKNVLNNLYEKKAVEQRPKPVENLRLRLRFKEAIEEAQKICEKDTTSEACHWAWYEVDELEDSIMRR